MVQRGNLGPGVGGWVINTTCTIRNGLVHRITARVAGKENDSVASDSNGAWDVFVRDRGFDVPSLFRTGTCAGITLDIYTATPSGQVAIIYGSPGNSTKAGNPCMGSPSILPV